MSAPSWACKVGGLVIGFRKILELRSDIRFIIDFRVHSGSGIFASSRAGQCHFE